MKNRKLTLKEAKKNTSKKAKKKTENIEKKKKEKTVKWAGTNSRDKSEMHACCRYKLARCKDII
jgi:hypothetical protein